MQQELYRIFESSDSKPKKVTLKINHDTSNTFITVYVDDDSFKFKKLSNVDHLYVYEYQKKIFTLRCLLYTSDAADE